MPHILLKRTFKEKERKNEKALSFHGTNLSPALMGLINERCAMGIKYSGGSKLLTFAINREGHYYAPSESLFPISLYDIPMHSRAHHLIRPFLFVYQLK